MEDIFFIKNEDEYNAYKCLKPKHIHKYKKVTFICSSCNKKSIKTFDSLTIPFLCRSCKSRQAQLNENTRLKARKTCLERYGVENVHQNKNIIEKGKETCLERYGVENASSSLEIKLKKKKTCLEKYGIDSYMKTDEFKQKAKETCLKRYGVERAINSDEIQNKIKSTCLEKYGVSSYIKTNDFKEKSKETCLERYNVENAHQNKNIIDKTEETCLEKYGVHNVHQNENVINKAKETLIKNYGVDNPSKSKIILQKKIITYHNNMISKYEEKLKKLDISYLSNDAKKFKLKCNKCNTEFEFSYSYFYVLINSMQECFCPNCSRVNHSGYSFKEKELFNYIKNIYNGVIVENDRTTLNGKEIDIYLPDLKIGFEFDGTYWHADPRFFAAADLIFSRPVKEIWDNDKNKDELCEAKGISLIRIKEYEWNTDKENIQNRIKEIITK